MLEAARELQPAATTAYELLLRRRLDRDEHADVRLLPQRPGDRLRGLPPPGRPFSHRPSGTPVRVGHQRPRPARAPARPGRPGSPRPGSRPRAATTGRAGAGRRSCSAAVASSLRTVASWNRALHERGVAGRTSGSAVAPAAGPVGAAVSRAQPGPRRPSRSAFGLVEEDVHRRARGDRVVVLVRLAGVDQPDVLQLLDRQVQGERARPRPAGWPAGGSGSTTTERRRPGPIRADQFGRERLRGPHLDRHPDQPVGARRRCPGRTWYW